MDTINNKKNKTLTAESGNANKNQVISSRKGLLPKLLFKATEPPPINKKTTDNGSITALKRVTSIGGPGAFADASLVESRTNSIKSNSGIVFDLFKNAICSLNISWIKICTVLL